MADKRFNLDQVTEHLPETNGDTEARKLPPVHLWKPDFSGDIDMQIRADGTWWHEGGQIKRPAMVTMFASILWKEADEYFLVTPVEKVRIQVEDVPLFVTELRVTETDDQQQLSFITSTEDVVLCDADHPLRVETDPNSGEPSPYIAVRYGMEARLNRNAFYQLVELGYEAEIDGQQHLVVDSAGSQFSLGML